MATRDHNLIWESLNSLEQVTNEETPDMVDSGESPKTLQSALERLSKLDIDSLDDPDGHGEGRDEALKFLFAAIEVIEDEIAYQAKVMGGEPDTNAVFGKPSFAGAGKLKPSKDNPMFAGKAGAPHSPMGQ